MKRYDIINTMIKKYNYVNYLEIGVRDPSQCFDKIIAEHKDGVDPEPLGNNVNYPITSDQFFELIKDEDIKYDIIFIDGLHLMEQVDKDIENSLKHLTDNGVIVMHDCNPPTEFYQRENYEVDGQFPPWNGTVWKSFAKLRLNNQDLDLCCVDCDWGIGIIRRGVSSNPKLSGKLDFNFLNKNRKYLLNLISVNEFIKGY